MNSLVILVVCWNNADDVIECIESLRAQSKNDFTILALDNASPDPSEPQRVREFIERNQSKTGPALEYLESDRNDGTAGAFSIGAQWAIDREFDFFGALNADATADTYWLEELYDELVAHDNTGVVTGKLLRRDGKTIDTTGDFYATWGLPSPRLRDRPADEAPAESGYIFGVSGGDFLARTQVFREVGMFDRNYFMYYEDVDMWFRAQLRGWRARYTPGSIAYHKLGASSKTVPGLAVYNTFKNLPMLFTKNVPLRLWPVIYPRFVLTYGLIFASNVRKGSGAYALKGWIRSIGLIPHMFYERYKIQRSRTVPDSYISSIIIHDIPAEQTGLRKFRAIFTGKK